MAKNKKSQAQWPKQPIVLRMLRKNIPLSQWQSYMETGDGAGFFSRKNPEYEAQEIFRQLSHPDAVAIVAREWEHLTADIRMLIGTKAKDGNASGNVKKGCQALNELLGGKLLREEREMTTRVAGRDIRVNPAVAGATRKYGVVDGPLSIKTRR
jgi:hypothetical protein